MILGLLRRINENEVAVANHIARERVLLVCLVVSWIFFVITWVCMNGEEGSNGEIHREL